MKKVSVIVPCYNESEVLPAFYESMTDIINKCAEYEFELLFVNPREEREDVLNAVKNYRIAA